MQTRLEIETPQVALELIAKKHAEKSVMENSENFPIFNCLFRKAQNSFHEETFTKLKKTSFCDGY